MTLRTSPSLAGLPDGRPLVPRAGRDPAAALVYELVGRAGMSMELLRLGENDSPVSGKRGSIPL